MTKKNQNWVRRHSWALAILTMSCLVIGLLLFIVWDANRYNRTERGFVESIEFISEVYDYSSTGHKVTIRLDNGDYLELANTMDAEDLYGLHAGDYIEFAWNTRRFTIKHFRLLERTR